MIWLLLGLACSGSPDPHRAALGHYDRGRKLQEAGDLGAAAEAFAQAAALDPASPELPAWQAQALEAGGREDEAMAVYDEAIQRFPKDVELRYNRAALSARQGDVEQAARDLRFLYARDLLDPAEAGEDEDFAALREVPDTMALVPQPQVWLDTKAEEGAVLLGSTWTLALIVEAPRGPALDLRPMGPQSSLLRLERVVEDLTAQGQRSERRELQASWRALAPGKGLLGPFLVSAGASSAMGPQLEVEVLEIGSTPKGVEGAAFLDLLVPSTLTAGRPAPWAGRKADLLVAIGAPGDKVKGAPELGTGVQIELREAGQTRWEGRVWPARPGAVVEVLRDGKAVARHPD